MGSIKPIGIRFSVKKLVSLVETRILFKKLVGQFSGWMLFKTVHSGGTPYSPMYHARRAIHGGIGRMPASYRRIVTDMVLGEPS
jgi:hypothetical protein